MQHHINRTRHLIDRNTRRAIRRVDWSGVDLRTFLIGAGWLFVIAFIGALASYFTGV